MVRILVPNRVNNRLNEERMTDAENPLLHRFFFLSSLNNLIISINS